MTPKIFAEKLIASAQAIGWATAEENLFVSRQFRGRTEASSAVFPEHVIGLRLGHYPLLVAPVNLADAERMQLDLRAVHNQMIIARSYMRAEEVINAHIFLCAAVTAPGSDWRRMVDLAERDETVCRKVVWTPAEEDVEASYQQFLARTFLAIPWANTETVTDAPLDHNQGLAQRILTENGLEPGAAEQWVRLVSNFKDDADGLVHQFVEAMETRDDALPH